MLDLLGSAFHFCQQIVRFFAGPLAPGNLFARSIALGLAALGGGNAFAPLAIQRTEALEIYAHTAIGGHFLEVRQVLGEVVEIMHGRTGYRNLAAQETRHYHGRIRLAVGQRGGPYILAAVIMEFTPEWSKLRHSQSRAPRKAATNSSGGFGIQFCEATEFVAEGWWPPRASKFPWSLGAMTLEKLSLSATSARIGPSRYRLDATMDTPSNVLTMVAVSMPTPASAAWFLPLPRIPTSSVTASTRGASHLKSATAMCGHISPIPKDVRPAAARPRRCRNCQNTAAAIASPIFPPRWIAAWIPPSSA